MTRAFNVNEHQASVRSNSSSPKQSDQQEKERADKSGPSCSGNQEQPRDIPESLSSVSSEDSIDLDDLINANFTTSMEDETDLPELSTLDLDDSKESFWNLDVLHGLEKWSAKTLDRVQIRSKFNRERLKMIRNPICSPLNVEKGNGASALTDGEPINKMRQASGAAKNVKVLSSIERTQFTALQDATSTCSETRPTRIVCSRSATPLTDHVRRSQSCGRAPCAIAPSIPATERPSSSFPSRCETKDSLPIVTSKVPPIHSRLATRGSHIPAPPTTRPSRYAGTLTDSISASKSTSRIGLPRRSNTRVVGEKMTPKQHEDIRRNAISRSKTLSHLQNSTTSTHKNIIGIAAKESTAEVSVNAAATPVSDRPGFPGSRTKTMRRTAATADAKTSSYRGT
ncbi:hypothetical protein EC973_006632 [Apophysomyces ossiformis]|uniref:Uncharacterized protein n=1 Tax=Apophysomyces ossiformis TaxID=679940 RepID=A0A8H7EQD0_9FUNG|nr:hypothetical protein EC973_006632 [Apophysomyces ossiformis]